MQEGTRSEPALKFFADSVVKPYIQRAGYRRVCEIGASYGENTDRLIELEGLAIDIIDP